MPTLGVWLDILLIVIVDIYNKMCPEYISKQYIQNIYPNSISRIYIQTVYCSAYPNDILASGLGFRGSGLGFRFRAEG